MDNFQDETQFAHKNQPEKQTSDTELQQCQMHLEEVKNSYVRLVADFENYKKRQEKERSQWTRLAQIEVTAPLLSIIDDFERALEQTNKNETPQTIITGFELIHKELLKYLDKVGIKEITVKPQDEFNPELHESVMSVHSDQKPDTIVQVLQKGYMFKDFILRPAKVSIAIP